MTKNILKPVSALSIKVAKLLIYMMFLVTLDHVHSSNSNFIYL